MNAIPLPQPFWVVPGDHRATRLLMTPIIDTLAVLIRTGSRLWHPFAEERATQIRILAVDLENWAKQCRSLGFQIVKLGEPQTHTTQVLSDMAFHRHCEEGSVEWPNASEQLAADFCVRVAFEIIEETIGILMMEAYTRSLHNFAMSDANRLKRMWAILNEVLATGSRIEFHEQVGSAAVEAKRYSLSLECQGLAFMQTAIESASEQQFGKPGTGSGKKLSNAKLQSLAAEIGIPFEEMKSLSDDGPTDWNGVTGGYETEAAETAKKIFERLSQSSTYEHVAKAAIAKFTPGKCVNETVPKLQSETVSLETKMAIAALIHKYEIVAANHE